MQDINLDSIKVLAYIIKKCAALGYDINYTKAQKLLYCCYGTVLGQFEIRLCKEHPKAWQYGPAFPRAFRAHHKNDIDFTDDPISKENFNKAVKYVIDETIKFFGNKSASFLSSWTHIKGSPWSICSNNGKHLYIDIDDEIIKQYFKNNVLDEYDGPEY